MKSSPPSARAAWGGLSRHRHQLNRDVAIKVLPAVLSRTMPDRLARFQREAEVLASLNHPNIAAIYGLEKTPATSPRS